TTRRRRARPPRPPSPALIEAVDPPRWADSHGRMPSVQAPLEQRVPIRVGVAVSEGHSELAGAASVTREKLELFCEALGDALGGPGGPFGVAHYRELLEAMHDGRLDLAWLPPIIALRATARGRTLPIAIPLRG